MDEMIIEWIEIHTTLHYNVEMLYCVNHYEVLITYNDQPYAGPFSGETLLEAFVEAIRNHP